MRDFLKSLGHAVRVLRKNPGFTLSALSVLTLGIRKSSFSSSRDSFRFDWT